MQLPVTNGVACCSLVIFVLYCLTSQKISVADVQMVKNVSTLESDVSEHLAQPTSANLKW